MIVLGQRDNDKDERDAKVLAAKIGSLHQTKKNHEANQSTLAEKVEQYGDQYREVWASEGTDPGE